jgi:DNA-binding beta-propeller fold protein YncE
MSVPMRRVVALVVLAALVWVRPVFAEDAGAPATPAPSGIAIDAEGDVYVSDYALDRIVKFGPDGTVLAQWGGSGGALGQFNAPFGLAVDASDTLYVVDQLNNRVQRFATDGTPLSAWGGPGAAAGELRTPFGVAVSGGRVYVADFGNDRVQVFGTDGSVLFSFGRRGSGDGQFQRPAGVAVAADGGVYVTDHFNDRIEHFNSDGKFVTQLAAGQAGVATATPGVLASMTPTATPGQVALSASAPAMAAIPVVALVSATSDAQLRRPEGIAVDHDGDVWVADYGRDRIVKFSPDGRLLLSWGSSGSGPDEFLGPKGVAIDPSSGRIYVADTGNARVQRFAPDGTLEASWPMP